MAVEPHSIDPQEQRAIIGLCVLAAFADGTQGEDERARIQQIAHNFSGPGLDVASVYQDVLGGKFTLATAAGQLQTPSARLLAYEMAVCVCNADGVVNDSEKKFLSDLHQALQLETSATDNHQQTAQALAAQPPAMRRARRLLDANREAELDRLILNAAILNGALEIMPHTLATLAIVPLQMRHGLPHRPGLRIRTGARAHQGLSRHRGHWPDLAGFRGIHAASRSAVSRAGWPADCWAGWWGRSPARLSHSPPLTPLDEWPEDITPAGEASARRS